MATDVMGVLWCDSIEFTVPRDALSTKVFPFLEQQIKAVAEVVGLELVDYEHVLFHPIPQSTDVRVMMRSGAWVRSFYQNRG